MNQTLTVKTAFWVVIISILFALMVGSVPFLFSNSPFSETNSRSLSLLSMFVGQTFMIIPLFIFLRVRKKPIKEMLRIHSVPLNIIFTTILLSFGVVILLDEIDRIANLFLPQAELLTQLSSLLAFDSLGTAIILLVTISILAPLSEELLFRGFLQKVLEESWKDVTKAVLITSMFFAFIHMNPYWIIQIYLIGILLGYLAWRTGSIIPSFILHGFNNCIALVLNNASPSIESFYLWNGHVSPPFLALAGGVFFLGFKRLNSQVELLA